MKAQRKRNPGWFRPGPDPRRHQLTREERQRGGYASWKRCFIVWGPYPLFEMIDRLEDLNRARAKEGRRKVVMA